MQIPNPRKVNDIAKQILEIMPESEIYAREQIKKFIEGLWNQAPEMLTDAYNWNKFISLLNLVINSEPTEWKNQIRLILEKF